MSENLLMQLRKDNKFGWLSAAIQGRMIGMERKIFTCASNCYFFVKHETGESSLQKSKYMAAVFLSR